MKLPPASRKLLVIILADFTVRQLGKVAATGYRVTRLMKGMIILRRRVRERRDCLELLLQLLLGQLRLR